MPLRGIFRSLLALIVPMGVAVDALAQNAPDLTNDFRVRITAGSSDNIQRRSQFPQSGSYRALGFVVNTNRQGPRLNANVVGNVDFREYSSANIPDERIGSINAFAGINILPEAFSWVFNDTYGQGRTDPFRIAGPTNRQQINIFSTGPRINLPLGSRTFLQLNLTESRRRFENTGNLDSDSTDGNLGLFRDISRVSQVGLVVTTRDITYEDNPLLSWEVEAVSLSYNRQLASGSASVQFGENTVDFGVLERTRPLIDLAWNRRVGARTLLTISGNRSQSDPSDGFLRANILTNPVAIGAANAFLGPGVFDTRELGITSATSYDRMNFSVTIAASETDYASNTGFNNEQERFAFRIARDISTRMRVGLSTNVLYRTFVALDREDIDRNSQLFFARSFVRRMDLQFTYQRWKRDTQGVAPFEENIYEVSVTIDLNP